LPQDLVTPFEELHPSPPFRASLARPPAPRTLRSSAVARLEEVDQACPPTADRVPLVHVVLVDLPVRRGGETPLQVRLARVQRVEVSLDHLRWHPSGRVRAFRGADFLP